MTTMESVQAVFQFMGGLGMFLYGMHIMADGLQKSAGSRVKKLLGFLTNNRIMAIMVGALITAIIQSSFLCSSAYWNWRSDAAVLQKSEEGDGGRDLDRHRAALYRA